MLEQASNEVDDATRRHTERTAVVSLCQCLERLHPFEDANGRVFDSFCRTFCFSPWVMKLMRRATRICSMAPPMARSRRKSARDKRRSGKYAMPAPARTRQSQGLHRQKQGRNGRANFNEACRTFASRKKSGALDPVLFCDFRLSSE